MIYNDYPDLDAPLNFHTRRLDFDFLIAVGALLPFIFAIFNFLQLIDYCFFLATILGETGNRLL